MRDRREEQIQEYAKWIKQFSWSWFATLKFTSGVPSVPRASRMFADWLGGVKAEEGGEDFRWVRVLERGATGENAHFHALIGGLRNRRLKWIDRWKAVGGNALIVPYDPKRDAVLYMLKETSAAGDLDIDFLLPGPGAAD